MLVATEFDRPIWDDGRRTVITIGAYDGLHRGHRDVIARVRSIAAERGARSAVVTFDRHPASVVRPDSAPCLLTDPDRRLELFAETGLDAALIVTFDHAQADEEPERFVERVVVNAASTCAVVVGSDFHFGRGRAGTLDLLVELGRVHDFDVIPVPLLDATVVERRGPISSTAIRAAVAEGRVGDAAEMLGRPYEIGGVVQRGDQRGRTIGFPTANVPMPPGRCGPAEGVYAGLVERADGAVHPAAINVGRRPTFHAEQPTDTPAVLIEAHLIDTTADLYGEAIRVRFIEFLRPEQRFAGAAELAEQLRVDVERAAALLAADR